MKGNVLFLKIRGLFVLVFLYAQLIYAQNDSSVSCKVKHANTKNIQSLAVSITQNAASDEDKVCAIYGWITSHIKYDFKKAVNQDFKRITPETTLKKRTAICLGYSDLFIALCKEVNIPCAPVYGYTKYALLKVSDTIYLTRHVWNAALIDGKWKLFDATWDAGYISTLRRTCRGRLLKILSFGRYNIFFYKPKFIQHPTTKYYFKNGKQFYLDHFPSQKMWLLTDTIFTIKNFENDSTWYKGENYLNLEETSTSFDDARMQFSQLSDEEQLIAMGLESKLNNKINNLNIADAYTLLTKKELKSFESTEADSSIDNPVCRKIFRLSDSANLFYTQSIKELLTEKKRNLNNVRMIKKLCIDNNKYQIKLAGNGKKSMRKNFEQLNKSTDNINAHINSSNNTIKIFNSVKYDKLPWASSVNDAKEKKQSVLDSIIVNQTDSIKSTIIKIEKLQKTIYQTWDSYKLFLEENLDKNNDAAKLIYQNYNSRFFNYENDYTYQYYLRRWEAKALQKPTADTISKRTKRMSDSISLLFKDMAKLNKQLNKLYEKTLTNFIKLKSISYENDNFTDRFTTFIDNYILYRKQEKEWVNEWKKPIKEAAADIYAIRTILNYQIHTLHIENQLEKKYNKGLKKFVTNSFIGEKKVIVANKKVASTIKNVAKKRMSQANKMALKK